MDKKQLSERDICTKYITPALERSGWDILTQIREEFPLTKGWILVRGQIHIWAGNKLEFKLPISPNRLMALCDRLEESIEAAKSKQTDLLNALMSQV